MASNTYAVDINGSNNDSNLVLGSSNANINEGGSVDVTTLKSDVTTLKSDVTTLNSDVSTAKSDISNINQRVTSLEKNNNPKQKRMNILLFVADDFSSDFISRNNPFFRDKNGNSFTPNIDAWAENAMTWDKCYTNASICQSSRWHLNTGDSLHKYGHSETAQDSNILIENGINLIPSNKANTPYLVTTLTSLSQDPSASTGSGYTEVPVVTFNGVAIDTSFTSMLDQSGGFIFSALVHGLSSNPVIESSGNAVVVARALPFNGMYQTKPHKLGIDIKIMHRYMRENGYHTSKLMKDNYGPDNVNSNHANFDYIDNYQYIRGVQENSEIRGVVKNYAISNGIDLDFGDVGTVQDDTVLRNAWTLNRDPSKPFFAQINDYNTHQVNQRQLFTLVMTAITTKATTGSFPPSLEALMTEYLYFSGTDVSMGAPGTLTSIFPWAADNVNDTAMVVWLFSTYKMKVKADEDFKHILDLLSGKVFDQNDPSGINYTYNPELDVIKDTLVIFTGDHGSFSPIGKFGLTHHSFNVPLMMAWPSNSMPPAGWINGGHTNALVTFQDFYPTFAKLGDCKAPLPSHVTGVPFMDLERVYAKPQEYAILCRSEMPRLPKAIIVITDEWMLSWIPSAASNNGTNCPGTIMSNQWKAGVFSFDSSGEFITYTNPLTAPFLHTSALRYNTDPSGASPLQKYFWTTTQEYELYSVPKGFDYMRDSVSHFTNVYDSNPDVVAVLKKRLEDYITSCDLRITYNGVERPINMVHKKSVVSNLGLMPGRRFLPRIGPLLGNLPDSSELDIDGVPPISQFYGLVDNREEGKIVVNEFPQTNGTKKLIIDVSNDYTVTYALNPKSVLEGLPDVRLPLAGERLVYTRDSLVIDFLGRFQIPQLSVTLIGEGEVTAASLMGVNGMPQGEGTVGFIKPADFELAEGNAYSTVPRLTSLTVDAGQVLVVLVNAGGATGITIIANLIDSSGLLVDSYTLLTKDLDSSDIVPIAQAVLPGGTISAAELRIDTVGANKILYTEASLYIYAISGTLPGAVIYDKLGAGDYRVHYWKLLPESRVITIPANYSVLIKGEKVSMPDTEIIRVDA